MNSRKIINTLSLPALLHAILPVLMVYLIAGTVAQKYIGLYQATQIFFSDPILWVKGIPLPGVPVFLAIIAVNLVMKLVFKSPWNPRNAGIIITHIGALLLLAGGLLTALFSHEAYVDLVQGEVKSYASSYHDREFVVLDKEGQAVASFAHDDLKQGQRHSVEGLSLTVEEVCRNCEIVARRFVQPAHQGMAMHMQLNPKALEIEDEENMAGLTFRVQGAGQDVIYVVLENVPKLPEFQVGDQTYTFALRRTQRALPFAVELLAFKRTMHPGTGIPESYQSRVRIIDGESRWESLISMNEPLRYKGYTFFQSSFIETPSGDVSVLSAVWNAGRSFPYIAGIVMCIGLLVHLFVRRRGL